jgi:hypothetical protein
VKGAVLPACDIALFGYGVLGDVDYESEIAAKSDKFEQMANLSRGGACGVICGCHTLGGGLVRKSAAVAEGGKLLGVCDSTHVLDGQPYKSGAGLGVFTMRGIKAGVCVADDLYFPECLKTLSLCGCNLFVGLLEEQHNGIPPLLIRSYAYLFGVPFLLVAGKTAFFADITGCMAASPQEMSLFEAIPRNEYRVVNTRIKGLADFDSEDY